MLEISVVFNRKLEARSPSAPIFFLKSLN